MNPFLVCSLATVGVLAFGLILTIILTVSIVTSSLSDTWIKPGEQVIICKDKKFTVNPEKDGVFGLAFPKAASTKRITSEIFERSIQDPDLTEITRFRASDGDTVDIDFESNTYSRIEVYYYKEETYKYKSTSTNTGYDQDNDNKLDNPLVPQRGHTTRRRRHRSSSSSTKTGTKTVRYVALAVNGTGAISGSAVLPGDYEYGIELGGTVGSEYEMNITYNRKYYISDSPAINCTADKKTEFNSEKVSGYCAAIEMAYDGPITDPDNSEINLDLYCAQRMSSGDIAAIAVFAFFFICSLVMLCIAFSFQKKYGDSCRDGGAGGVEMN